MSCPERAFGLSRVLENRELAAGISLLSSAWEGPRPLPGQFFMLKPQFSSRFLGRAFSVFDQTDDRLSFLVFERGEGTRELRALREGDGLFLSGPLGSPWPLPFAGKASGKRPALMAGGVGIAPIAFLARSLEPGSYDLYAGFRSSPFGLEGLRPARLVLSSEEGRGAARGRILDFFEPGSASELHLCGPEPLLAAAAAMAEREKLPAWLCLERRMACGVGACLGCTVRTLRGNRRACVDGPVFPAGEVIFDEGR